MNISTVTIISQWCSQHTTSAHKASPTAQEVTVSKAANRGINNASSNNLITLQEIPTRISQPLATAAVVALHDDNDARYQQTLSSLSTVKENKNSSQQPFSSYAVKFYDDMEELDAIIARCNSWLQQQRPMPITSTDPNGTILDAPQLSSPPDTSSPRSSVMLASEDAMDHILKKSQCLLDTMRQQSQALSNLVATSDELVVLMTRVANVVDNLFSAQPPKLTLFPHPTQRQ